MQQIYVHGLGQTSASWERTCYYLNDNGQSVCPNLAEIVRGREINYQNLYKAFASICNEMDSPINLCGLSLGGVMALNYAKIYVSANGVREERVRSFV